MERVGGKGKHEALDNFELFFFRAGLEKKILTIGQVNEFLEQKQQGIDLKQYASKMPKTYTYLSKIATQRLHVHTAKTIQQIISFYSFKSPQD